MPSERPLLSWPGLPPCSELGFLHCMSIMSSEQMFCVSPTLCCHKALIKGVLDGLEGPPTSIRTGPIIVPRTPLSVETYGHVVAKDQTLAGMRSLDRTTRLSDRVENSLQSSQKMKIIILLLMVVGCSCFRGQSQTRKRTRIPCCWSAGPTTRQTSGWSLS